MARSNAYISGVPQDTIDFVEVTLSMEWSPEQISGVCRLIGMPLSHEWIYPIRGN